MFLDPVAHRASKEEPRLLTIRRGLGDFLEHSPSRLHQVACCCCTCCLQVPVGAGCGVLAAPLLLGIGYLPGRHRPSWPMWIRLVGMGLLLGGIEGMVALVLWFDWEDNILLYVAGCLAPLCLSLPMAWHALLADRPYREAYGRPLKLMRSVLAVIVLSVGLGSIAVSVLDDFNLNTPFRMVSTLVFPVAAVAGGLVAHKLARLEQRDGFIHPEPHFGRLTGVLVGANLALTFAAIPLLAVQTLPVWYPWILTGAAGLVGGLLSLRRCRMKNRATRPTRWRSWTALAVASDSLACGMAAIMGTVLWDNNSWPDILWMGGSMLAGAAIWLVLGILSHRSSPSTVVVPEDQPMVCLSCGYNLTGLPEPRCPECGREFDESQVRRARAYVPFPVTLWHPVSTGPVGGALVGSCLGVTIAAFL